MSKLMFASLRVIQRKNDAVEEGPINMMLTAGEAMFIQEYLNRCEVPTMEALGSKENESYREAVSEVLYSLAGTKYDVTHHVKQPHDGNVIKLSKRYAYRVSTYNYFE
jgi:hypothetical protein